MIRESAGRIACLALAAAGLACGGPGGHSDTWRFALEEIEGSVQHAYAGRFRELVAERSDGAVDVSIYPYGSLGTSAQLTEQVQSGALQLAFASPGHLGSVVPEAQVFSLHFVLSEDAEVNRRVFSGESRFRTLLDEAYGERRLRLLAIVPEGWMVWTADRPLRRPADFEGLKLRTMVSPLLLEAYRAYGAQPTPMPYGEVYSGLQLGMIDGQVNPVFAVEEMGFHRVQTHLTRARHATFVTTLVASPAFYDGLAPERRALLHGVVADLDAYALEVQQALNGERLEAIRREGGTQVIDIGEAERASFRRLSLPVRDAYRELAGPRGGRILDALLEEVARAETERSAS